MSADTDPFGRRAQHPRDGTNLPYFCRVQDHSRAERTDLLVLLAIARYARTDGTGAFPSLDTIAKCARVARRTAQRAIDRLVRSGELAVSYKAHPSGCNRYTLLVGDGDTRAFKPEGAPGHQQVQVEGVRKTEQGQLRSAPGHVGLVPGHSEVHDYLDTAASPEQEREPVIEQSREQELVFASHNLPEEDAHPAPAQPPTGATLDGQDPSASGSVPSPVDVAEQVQAALDAFTSRWSDEVSGHASAAIKAAFSEHATVVPPESAVELALTCRRKFPDDPLTAVEYALSWFAADAAREAA
jgi:hypothetical protein